MSDIKISDVFDLPFSVEPSGVISDDHCIAIGEFCGTMEQSKAAVHAINNHDKLTSRVAELEAALTKQKRALDGAMSQLSRPCNSINDLSFIAFVGVVEKEINELLKDGE